MAVRSAPGWAQGQPGGFASVFCGGTQMDVFKYGVRPGVERCRHENLLAVFSAMPRALMTSQRGKERKETGTDAASVFCSLD